MNWASGYLTVGMTRSPLAHGPVLQVAPTFSLYLTLVGILAGFVSTMWAFRYTRMANDITKYLAFKEGLLTEEEAKKVKKISKPEVGSDAVQAYLPAHLSQLPGSRHCRPIITVSAASCCTSRH